MTTALIGNDGLTKAQRDNYAEAYRQGAARPLSAYERQVFTAWQQKQRPFEGEGEWLLTDAEHVGEDVE